MSDLLWVGIGEACMVQHSVINNNNLKHIRSPFAWSPANIEQILEMEKTNYRFIDKVLNIASSLKSVKIPFPNRLNIFNNSPDSGSQNNIIFYHHDIINDKKEVSKLRERLNLFRNIEDQKVVFIYYYRQTFNYLDETGGNYDGTDNRFNPSKIREMLESFVKLKNKNNEAYVLFFYQYPDENKNECQLISKDNNVFEFVFNCQPWEGPNGEWKAEKQQELISNMIKEVESFIL